MRSARRTYYNKKIDENRSNLKTQWKYIKEVMGNVQGTEYPEYLIYKDKILNYPQHICNGFNDFVVNIGLNLAEQIPMPNKTFAEYLPHPNQKSMFLSPTTEREILLIFKNLSNIALFFIKPIITVILPQLVYILNLSFQQGVVPFRDKDC